MSILDAKIARLDGTPATLGEITAGRPALLVNVASRCGLTPQYAGLEELQEKYGDAASPWSACPCNQFYGQEPGSAEEIAEFCSATYGVTFPMTEKVEVNGEDRHAIYAPGRDAEREGRGRRRDLELREVPRRRPTARWSPGSARRSSPRTRGWSARCKALASSDRASDPDPPGDRRQVREGDDARLGGDDVRAPRW